MITKVVIPIAGNGSRMYIETMAVSKSLLPVLNKPVIVYILEEAYMAGLTEIILIISRNQKRDVLRFTKPLSDDELKKYDNDTLNRFNDLLKKVTINFVIQKEQLGLGHAILCSKELTKGDDFCVMLGDNLFLSPEKSMKALVDQYEQKSAYYIGVKEVPQKKVKDYGIALGSDYKSDDCQFKIDKLIEKPKTPISQNTACIGRYILKNSIYKYLSETTFGVNGEIQLTDALEKAIKNEDCYATIINSDFCDAGDKLGFVKTNLKYALIDEEIKDDVFSFIKEIIYSEMNNGSKETSKK